MISPLIVVDMFEPLFGSGIVEKILFYMTANQKCFASELGRFKKITYNPTTAIKQIIFYIHLLNDCNKKSLHLICSHIYFIPSFLKRLSDV